MTMTKTILSRPLMLLAVLLQPLAALAGGQADVPPAGRPATSDDVQCDAQGCSSEGIPLLQGLQPPAEAPRIAQSGVAPPPPPGGGAFMAELENGAVVWATEDPTMVPPALSVQSASMAAYENGRLERPLRFHTYNNYASFIRRIEVKLYRGTDIDLVTPLATIELPVGYVGDAEWDGALPEWANLRVGDEVLYVARAFGDGDAFDETQVQRIQLVTPADFQRGLEVTRNTVQKTLGQALGGEQAQDLQVSNSIYGQSTLRLQNIPIHGSRVRIYGNGLTRDSRVTINGQTFPVDQEQKFAAEFLEPVGTHRYEVTVDGRDTPTQSRQLQVDVSGRYAFLVALADDRLAQQRQRQS